MDATAKRSQGPAPRAGSVRFTDTWERWTGSEWAPIGAVARDEPVRAGSVRFTDTWERWTGSEWAPIIPRPVTH